MIIDQPLNIKIMDVDTFITDNKIFQVTSHNVFEASSTNFHPYGLYSEIIFGQIGSSDRLIKFGFVDLNTKVLHPLIYKNIVSLKKLYVDIMDGKIFVKYDPVIKDLVRAEEGEEGSGTGYSFFMDHLDMMEFKETESDKRSAKINVMKTYRDRLWVDKFLIMPAGIRDVRVENGRVTKEEINTLYSSLLSVSQAMPKGFDDNIIFDGIRNSIQKKIVDIYAYIQNLIDGKTGFLQKKYAARSVALGTRNVITASDMKAESPDDISFIKYNETQVPLLQTMKAAQPLVYKSITSLFLEDMFSQGAVNLAVIEPKTYKTVYTEISETEKNTFTTSDGIEKLINKFYNIDMRDQYVTIQSTNNKKYYLLLVYQDGDRISLFKDIEKFRSTFNGVIDEKKIRPITYVEMFYIATYFATYDKHILITRYPVLGIESIYPSKIKLVTTEESIKMKFVDNNGIVIETFPHYPAIGKKYIDSLAVHPSRLKPLDGDYDGDTVSANSVLMVESNNELLEYFNSPSSLVTPAGKLVTSLSTYLCEHVFYNFSKRSNKK